MKFFPKYSYLGALRLFLRMCRQLEMIRRLGYVRHIMIGGDARGAPDFGRVVLPGPTRPHTHTHTLFSGSPTRDWILFTQRMQVRGDWILPTQRTLRGGGRHFIYTKNVWRKIMWKQWYKQKFSALRAPICKELLRKSWQINDIVKNVPALRAPIC